MVPQPEREPEREPEQSGASGVPIQPGEGPVPEEWLIEVSEVDLADNVDRLAGDVNLVTDLALEKYEGPLWEYFSNELEAPSVGVTSPSRQRRGTSLLGRGVDARGYLWTVSNNSTDEPDDRPEPPSESAPDPDPIDYFTGAGADPDPDDTVGDVTDDAGQDEADQDDVGDDPTLKDLVTDKVWSPQLPDAANRVVREAMRNISLSQNQAVFKAMRNINFPVNSAAQKAMRNLAESSAPRNLKLAKLLPTIDSKRLIAPIVDHFKTTNSPLNARIRAQLAASLPSSQLTKQVEQIRKTAGASFLPRFTLPPSTFKTLYGPEFGGLATKLVKFQRLFENIDWERITTGWFPPNWDRDRGIEQYETFIELARTDGLPLAWVPNTELTYLLADADPDTRPALLIEHAPTILGDCETALADFDELTFLAESLNEAIAAYRDGHTRPALSMAASVIDTALREAFPDAPHMGFYPHIKNLLGESDDWKEADLRAARALPTSVAILGMIKNFRPDRDDPVPGHPNRHAAAHAVHPNQYTPVNAIKFLMLATAVLAELEYDGWARIVDIVGTEALIETALGGWAHWSDEQRLVVVASHDRASA